MRSRHCGAALAAPAFAILLILCACAPAKRLYPSRERPLIGPGCEIHASSDKLVAVDLKDGWTVSGRIIGADCRSRPAIILRPLNSTGFRPSIPPVDSLRIELDEIASIREISGGRMTPLGMSIVALFALLFLIGHTIGPFRYPMS